MTDSCFDLICGTMYKIQVDSLYKKKISSNLAKVNNRSVPFSSSCSLLWMLNLKFKSLLDSTEDVPWIPFFPLLIPTFFLLRKGCNLRPWATFFSYKLNMNEISFPFLQTKLMFSRKFSGSSNYLNLPCSKFDLTK